VVDTTIHQEATTITNLIVVVHSTPVVENHLEYLSQAAAEVVELVTVGVAEAVEPVV
jgi:hypothetical protein